MLREIKNIIPGGLLSAKENRRPEVITASAFKQFVPGPRFLIPELSISSLHFAGWIWYVVCLCLGLHSVDFRLFTFMAEALLDLAQ